MVFPWTGVIRLFSLINLAVLDFDFHVTNLLFYLQQFRQRKKKKLIEKEREKKSEKGNGKLNLMNYIVHLS